MKIIIVTIIGNKQNEKRHALRKMAKIALLKLDLFKIKK